MYRQIFNHEKFKKTKDKALITVLSVDLRCDSDLDK